MGASPFSREWRSFPQGGLHLPANKTTAGIPVGQLPLPPRLVLPLSQHIGAPARLVVAPGDRVLAGQLLAEASGFVSASVHAPAAGTVAGIEDVPDLSGYRRPAVIVEVSGEGPWADGIFPDAPVGVRPDCGPAAILELVRAAGVVGMGGAAFPTHVKLTVPPGKTPPEALLVNGAECEPFLTADHRLMLEEAPAIVAGLRLILEAARIPRALLGIEADKEDAVFAMRQAAGTDARICVLPLRMRYPQGGERQLVKALLGREIPPPPAGLPIDVGAAVINVATVFAVFEAVVRRKPLVDRVITVAGAGVASPGNYRVRFGTPVSWVLEKTGGMPADAGKVVAGGPMMGRALADLSVPVIKGMSGIVVFSAKEARRGEPTNCIRCGKCVAVCPLGLEPFLCAAYAERGDWNRAEREKVVNCCSCGCCSHVCPARRPLVEYMKLGRARVLEQRARRLSGEEI